MQYVLTMDQDNLPKGALVEVPGLGQFENGTTTDLTDEQVQTFRVTQGTFDDDGVYHHASTPLQEMKHALGVTVEVKKGDS